MGDVEDRALRARRLGAPGVACGVGVDIWWLGWRKLVQRYMDISDYGPFHRQF